MKEQKIVKCYRKGKFICAKGGRNYKENMMVLEWHLNKKLKIIDTYAHELVYYKSFVDTKTGEVKVILYD